TRHAPRRVFPLRFAQQPVRLASRARQPRHIFFGVVPRYIGHWATAFAPARFARALVAGAAAGSHAGVPLRERHLELAHGERLGERDRALRAFGEGAALLVLR